MSLIYDNKNDMLIERHALDMLPEPQAKGIYHKPYPFAEYIEDIHTSLRRHNITVGDEQYALQKDGERIFGIMTVGNFEDFQLTLGVRGSHDMSVARGIAIGTNVMVCSNLCFSGELFTGTAKQTTHNGDRILQMIDDAVSRIDSAGTEQVDKFSTYKTTEVSDYTVSKILTDCFRADGLSGAQLGKAIKEYDKPSYTEHDEYANTWKLLNAITQAIKPSGQGVDMNGIVRKTQICTNVLNTYL